jgi:hypothetical protein
VRTHGHSVDWKDAGAYAPLLAADRSILAWEWLRRTPAYRDAAERALGNRPAGEPSPEAREWGLHAFEQPELAAPRARPVWRAEVHPPVLAAVAGGPPATMDAFDLAMRRGLSTLVRSGEGREHLLLSDGLRAIRLDVVAGSVSAGPVQLRYLLSGLASAERPLLTLRRLLALWRSGRFAAALHPPERRARRWILLLRAADGLAAGAGQREIAEVLLSSSAADPRWRSAAPSVRSQAQRLVRSARLMTAGGYRELLR